MVVSELAKRDLNCSGSAEPPRFRNETKPHIIASDGTGLPLQFCVAACSPRKRFRRSLAHLQRRSIPLKLKSSEQLCDIVDFQFRTKPPTTVAAARSLHVAILSNRLRGSAAEISKRYVGWKWCHSNRGECQPPALASIDSRMHHTMFSLPTDRSINRSRPGGYERSGGDGGRLSVTCWAATSSSTPPPPLAPLFDAALWIPAACFDCFG